VEDEASGVFLEALRQVFAETGIRIGVIVPGGGLRGGGPVGQVLASVGVTGEVRCNLMLCADNRSADGILRGMTFGLPLPADRHGEFPRAAMGEIANQVAGRAVTLLAARDRRCDITPPTVVTADLIDSLLSGSVAAWTVHGDFGLLHLVTAQER
jgi:chemotaxis protein CheY-P-specific phosphatase CheC